jgi:ketosteroid isomerase-like protein
MRLATLICIFICSLTTSLTASAESKEQLAAQVQEAERGFAKTMADRDLVAFASFIAEDAVFFGETTLRGKNAVVDGWKGFFAGANAPFSWAPESVEVLESGTLAYSSGPVLDRQGNRIAMFNSVWRREANGQWKVVFDKGCEACRCK